MNPSILIDIAFEWFCSEEADRGACVIVEASGPSGNWDLSMQTDKTGLLQSLTKMASTWETLTNKYSNYKDEEDLYIDCVSLAGKDILLYLLATKRGLAVELCANSRFTGLMRHTRVWASKKEIDTFAQRLFQTTVGKNLGASLNYLFNRSREEHSAPLVEISLDKISGLRTVPPVIIPIDITIEDIRFVQRVLDELLEATLQNYDDEENTFTVYNSPSGAFSLTAVILYFDSDPETDLEKQENAISLTIGVSGIGALWTFTMTAAEIRKSKALLDDDKTLLLYGVTDLKNVL